ncbi:MAG: MBL fold metallo-hydrolase [Bacilli bacterium]|jgi:glyoxylase-like metal-dependent hydrolase (beta-lactamase superfamily II)|nr:MBL fold metallo-hydrolase [Bacilli bacterium]
MNEFTHIRGNTYCIEQKTNIGLIINDNKVILIDSGNDKDAGRKLRQLLEKQNLTIDYIINTHSNADHIGANAYLINQYNCKAYTYNREVFLTQYPDLEPAILYGGFPTKEMKNKFLMAKPSSIENIKQINNDIEYFEVPGHYLDMIAIKSNDNVIFLGDCLFSKEIITKYHLFYIYDIKAYLETLDKLIMMNNEKKFIFVPSHGLISDNIKDVIELNKNKIYEIINLILSLLENKITFDTLLKKVMDYYHLTLDLNQYLLVGSTIRNYLSYLSNENKINFVIEENKLYYEII